MARQGALWLVIVTAAVTGVAWALGAHEFAAGYLLAPATSAVAVAAYRARGQRFPRGLWAGVASSVVGIVGLATVVFTAHAHESTSSHADEALLLGFVGLLGLLVLGVVVIAVEGFAQHMTLPSDTRAADAERPVFPAARVVER